MGKVREKYGHGLLPWPAVSVIVENQTHEILLIQRGDDLGWSLPGGAVDGAEPAGFIGRRPLPVHRHRRLGPGAALLHPADAIELHL